MLFFLTSHKLNMSWLDRMYNLIHLIIRYYILFVTILDLNLFFKHHIITIHFFFFYSVWALLTNVRLLCQRILYTEIVEITCKSALCLYACHPVGVACLLWIWKYILYSFLYLRWKINYHLKKLHFKINDTLFILQMSRHHA